jgi:transposase-like protein
VLVSTWSKLRELVTSCGLQVFEALLEADREALCGPRSAVQRDRAAYRHGHDTGLVVFGGRKIRVRKPRVRGVDGGGEVELPTWSRMTAEDPLRDRVVEQVLAGVSTRQYGRSLEPLGEDIDESSTSRSSASRQFVGATARKLGEFLSRPLSEIDFPVVMIDGTHLGDHLALVVLGIDRSGKKHVLGVAEGTTESSATCSALLRELIGRGLTVERARLFVIDGGKGLRKAIRTVFGQWALIQRCRIHKLRNVVEQLPKHRQAWFRSAIRKAWNASDASKARGQIETLARQLEGEHPTAASSLEEGLDETLTVLTLGIGGALLRTLSSTHPIENMQGTIKRVTRNVKRCRDGRMVLRWVGVAVLEAESHFRRIKGHREMPALIAAIERLVARRRGVDNVGEVA